MTQELEQREAGNALAELFAGLPGYHDEAENNRGYIGWAPGADYMSSKGDGWSSNLVRETWRDFAGDSAGWDLDLNLVADFYFSLTHDTKHCPACDQSGYNPATKRIADDFYDFDRRGTEWCAAITQDEVQALVDANRLWDFTRSIVPGEGWKVNDPPTIPTAAEVNAWQGGRGIGHDAINRYILIEARAKRLGVYGKCETCEGHGEIRTGRDRIEMYLWLLHPRKGASRGVTIRHVRPDDLPAVREWLRTNFEHHRANRFAWALEASPPKGAVE